MRILKLLVENINSLYGTRTIDFEDPKYTENGLFVLTGPTGAGKTTILDAICLALYGQTPRVANISKNQNDIMSRGAKTCRAELLFEVNGKRYLAHWSQALNRNNNLNAANHEICDGGSAGKNVIESGLTKTAKFIEELTGLTFDQFCRTVLLPQGDFDRFLSAKPSEKMGLFAKITGAERYKEISAKVRQKRDACKKSLGDIEGRLEGISVLSDEKLEQLRLQVAANEARKKSIRGEIDKGKEDIQWLDDVKSLESRKAETERQITEHKAAEESFRPNAEKLKRAELALPISAAYSNLVSKEQESRQTEDELDKVCERIPGDEKNLSDLQEELKEKNQACENSRRSQEEARPEINKVRQLDTELASLRTKLADAENTRGEKTCDRDTKKRNLEETVKKSAEKETELRSIRKYFEEHADDGNLVGDVKSIENDLNDVEERKTDLEKAKAELNQSADELLAAQETLDKAKAGCKTFEDRLKEAKANTKALNVRKTALLNGNSPEDLDREIDALNKEVIAAQTMEKHQSMLVEGKPCPLCGAVHHPYAGGNFPSAEGKETELEALKKVRKEAGELDRQIRDSEKDEDAANLKLTECRGKVETAQVQVNSCRTQHKKARIALGAAEEAFRTKESKVRGTLRGYGVSEEDPFDPQTVLTDLKTRLNVWQNKTEEKEAAEERLRQLNERLAGLKADAANAETALGEAQKAYDEAESQLNAKRTERENLFQDKDPDAEEKRLQDAVNDAQKAYDKAKDAVSDAEKYLDQNKKDKSRLESARSQIAEALAGLRESFDQALKDRNFESRDDFKSALLEEDELVELRSQQQELNTRGAQLEGEMNTIQNSLDKKRKENKTEKSAEEIQEEINRAEGEFAEIEEEIKGQNLMIAGDAERRAAQEKMLDDQKKIQLELEQWNRLWDVLGPYTSSFSDFVQSLTFDWVIRHANKRLELMMPRYELKRRIDPDSSKDRKNKKGEGPEPSGSEEELKLDLNVIDHDQGDEERVVENLSGGERFVISLAMSLGISCLAKTHTRIDSIDMLFLDEGFGTLDENTLDGAIDALEQLHQNEGKMIGIVTHVERLQGEDSRIQTQIRVEKIGNGRSVVEGPGVIDLPNGTKISLRPEP